MMHIVQSGKVISYGNAEAMEATALVLLGLVLVITLVIGMGLGAALYSHYTMYYSNTSVGWGYGGSMKVLHFM
jgi:hypothetical protein